MTCNSRTDSCDNVNGRPAFGRAVSRGTAEERVVVVDAVDRDARVDATLTGELDVPVDRVLLRVRREEDEVREVAPVDREAADRVVVDRGLAGRLRRLDRGTSPVIVMSAERGARRSLKSTVGAAPSVITTRGSFRLPKPERDAVTE